jgi:CRP/FNR family transcriptional regulator, cyclic AMP receptor protein
MDVSLEAVQHVPLFVDWNTHEVEEIARLFKERRFSRGETVVKEGSVGDSFFLIDAGEAGVFIRGKGRTTLKPGDYFGEIAIIASTELVCHELTSRDFRSLVESNGVVGWKVLQRLVMLLRATRKEANELESALGTLRHFDDQYPG